MRYVALTALVALCMSTACFAQVQNGTASAPSRQTESLEAAFDRAFAPNGRYRYTGAVVAVVQDGRVLFVKGYGHEDSTGTIPVDATRTKFRLGSITKTLIAIGIGKLIDTNRISSLDAPVNLYLKGITVPPNDGREITLRMLGTHQAGLAEARQPFQRYGDAPVRLDNAYLAAHFPGYVVSTNSGSNYSNYGATLLGQVVASQTGGSFQSFVQREIFAPIGMTHSELLTDPAPRPNVAQANAFYANGGRRQIPDLWSNNPGNIPAGALASTGSDMARYMIGLMGGGPGIPALLSPRGTEAVMSRQGGTHPLTQGYGVLFMINDWNDNRLVEHGGRTLGASSYLSLMPDRRTGIFVATSGDAGQTLPLGALLGLPAAPPADSSQAGKTLAGLSQLRAIGLESALGRWRLPIAPETSLPFSAIDYTGQYVGQRRAIRSVTQVFSDVFLGGPLTISAGSAGTLMLGRTPYRQVAQDVFWHDAALTQDRPSGWNDLLVFRRDGSGRVTDASLLYSDVVYRRTDGLVTPSTANRFLLIGALVLLTGSLSFLWSSHARGRIVAPIAAGMVLLSPIVYFRSWPEAAVESLSYVWIRSSDLVIFQLWLNATALLSALLIAFALIGMIRVEPATGWRAITARWHLRLLAVSATLLIIGFGWYGMIGWNIA